MSTIPKRQDAVNDPAPRGAGSAGDPPSPRTSARTSAGDAFSELAVLVIRLHGQLGAAGDGLARPAGQTSARWQVLAGAEDGSRSVADVARTLGLARQSVQRIADLLERDGLVAYADNPRHRRARLLVLTAAGRDVLTTIQVRQRAWADRLGKEVGERPIRDASAALQRLLLLLTARRARAG